MNLSGQHFQKRRDAFFNKERRKVEGWGRWKEIKRELMTAGKIRIPSMDATMMVVFRPGGDAGKCKLECTDLIQSKRLCGKYAVRRKSA